MALSTGIFKTPTGQIYDQAREIERGFDKTTGIVTDFLQRKANDYDQQQALFGELSNKLGEIEANLQQNYAGMQQQAVDSTREWLKQSIKSGTRANDPEFQMALGQRVGAIRAAMGNADKIRQQIDLQVKMIESNPYMDFTGKSNALTELFSMANNPDVLIDKNAVQKLSQVPNKYIDPFLVARESYNKNPAQGTTQEIFMDEQGNERIREISLTDLTDVNNPFDENGRINFSKLTPERVNEILNRDSAFNNVVEQIRQRDMPNKNQDEARAEIVKQLYSGVANTQQATKIRRTADQILSEKMAAEGQALDLKYKLAQIRNVNAQADARNKAGQVTEARQEDYKKFFGNFESGDNAAFTPYGKGLRAAGMSNVKWTKELPIPKVTDLSKWNTLTLDQKKQAFKLVGEENPDAMLMRDPLTEKTRPITDEDFEKNAVYKVFNEKRSKANATITGIQYTNKDGEIVTLSFDDLGGPSGLYDLLESYRYSGSKYIPTFNQYDQYDQQGEKPKAY
jgi:hypothetical protein